MGFLGVYNALYDYVPQSDQELAFQEGDLLFLLEKSTEDDWWKAKRRVLGEDGDEPVGLIPSNYVEEATPIRSAKALYDYTRQTDEELSLTEDATLAVYDTSDPDWILVGVDGEYGFAPANYIELGNDSPRAASSSPLVSHSPEPENEEGQPESPIPPASPVQSPAAALAGIIQAKAPTPALPSSPSPPPAHEPSRERSYSDDEYDRRSPTPPSPPTPALPERSPLQRAPLAINTTIARSPEPSGVVGSPPWNRAARNSPHSPGGFHLYNISEMVSVMGKRKKMPTTLGLNVATGTIMISPEKSKDGPEQEWSADKLTHYSLEGKHVFLDLVRPSRSVDLHAGAKDTAEEIVATLGEMAGAARAEGLREVIAAGSGSRQRQKKGQVLYDFAAQGDDEVTVQVGDEVIVLDDTKSDEWWMVRRVRNGREGVMPSSYVEVTGVTSPPTSGTSAIDAGRSTVEKNRLEEERLAKAAAWSHRNRNGSESRAAEVGMGVKLPERGSSLMSKDRTNSTASGSMRTSTSVRARPDSTKTRTWTDRSGTFKVEAQFLGCSDGKIHLHKLNGVKIAVPVVKMALEDLEYVERITGLSLDEDKPLSNIKRDSRNGPSQVKKETNQSASAPAAATVVERPNKDDYDWFDFFLKCGVGVHQCERYASSFSKDSMDESVLPDITPEVLRTLGLKEGDILKVMKFLDTKFGRNAAGRAKRNVSFGGTEVMGRGEGEGDAKSGTNADGGGGLFSGPGGALRNNTRKGRPAPAVQTNDVVDPKVFEQALKKEEKPLPVPSDSEPVPEAPPPPVRKDTKYFDDDAWDVKPSREQPLPSKPSNSQPATGSQPAQNNLTGSMKELSLLSAPLQPVVAHTTGIQQQPQPQQSVSGPLSQSNQGQPSGALAYQPTQSGPGLSVESKPQPAAFPPAMPSNLNSQQFGPGFQQQGILPARGRPQAPPTMPQANAPFAIPPPPRPFSAPQNNFQQSTFAPPPLQAQLTGVNPGSNIPRVAPPGQSLHEINQARFQQMALQQQLPTFGQVSNGLMPQLTGVGVPAQPMMPQATGLGPQQGFLGTFQSSQQFIPSQTTGFPMANPQPAGNLSAFTSQPINNPSIYTIAPPQQPMPTGNVNSFLPPALQPQRTGLNGFTQTMSQPGPAIPPAPEIPQQPSLAPLQPQKTGPPPPIRFGVTPAAAKLAPQPTGRRANLSQATPQNPFGF